MKAEPEAALKARIATISGVPKAWPNQDYDPSGVGKVPYLACEIVRASTSDATLDAAAPVVIGRLIVTVVTNKGIGEATANQLSAQVADLFPMGLRINTGNIATTITQPPHIREGMTDGTYWRVPISIPFQIFTTPV